ncbi:RagB/SusD family nutrient uptake outer membrane protein [[Flexibacter] sp. ATCC 35208]|uniref:RagB/SusD family nutrient uptake outer membrane protein n=1 Tax=[Flexibacter] sp. ATCC 35208 TaxID=1936242 RepID=UPI0009CE18B1|nr:RagB/SusD family nutrient uptake outer membrane protein [[Flexibacter] sp. ATCC 35208]OMP74825.1 RagB/SusD family nutrient uptake outer membrane protein [[Flexibacter] sp. ATCC 35208]
MKKHHILLFILLAGSGCKKYLEQAPDQRTQLNSVDKVAELLGTAYPQGDYATFTEAASDNAADKGTGGTVSLEINTNPYYFRDVIDKTEGSPTYYWNNCYKAIAACNQALQAIENADNPADYNAQKGEALVARAYAHFMLVTLFSKVYDAATAAQDPGIPYVTTPENVVIKQYERKTVAYVYEQIEKDLTTGLPLIKNTSYTIPKYHFTTSAANAFATRFYLFKKDYQKVLTYAANVFPGGNIKSNLRQWVTVYQNLTAAEALALYTNATEPANLLLVEAPSIWARNVAQYRYGLQTDLVYNLYRYPNVTGATWVQPLYYVGDNTDNWEILKFREHFVRSSANADIGVPYTIFPLFTAEEVLFNRAEANIYLGNYDAAKQDLNDYASMRIDGYNTSYRITNTKLTNFYGTTDVKTGLIYTLLDFKQAEFMQEGMRWFDILRYHIPVSHSGETLTGDDLRRLFQLPQEVKLSGIEQNPR